jgi:hypothetical protein
MAIISNQLKDTYKALAIATIKITVAGVAIGLFKEYDLILAILVAAYILKVFYQQIISRKNKEWILFIGMVTTGTLGIIAEKWGVYNHYWEYHDLTENRQLPYWLPFAWMYAFKIIYDLEKKIVEILKIKKISQKIIIAILITAFFPVFGEIVTVYLSVWTYYWPYQILGIPLYAVLCLVILHMFVNCILYFIAHKYKIQNTLFNPEKKNN